MNSKALFNATCWSILGDFCMVIALLRQFGYRLLKSRGTGLLSQFTNGYFDGSFESRRVS